MKIKRKKDKSCIISRDTENSFDKIQPQFAIKTFNKSERQRNLTSKKIYEKPTGNIVLNGERLNAFS